MINGNLVRGLFHWTPAGWSNDVNARDTLLDFCETRGVNQLYFSTAGVQETSIASLVADAHGRDIRVLALGGDTNWALNPRSTISEFLQPLGNYQRRASGAQRLDGYVFDVEYWLGAPSSEQIEASRLGMRELLGWSRAELGGDAAWVTSFWTIDEDVGRWDGQSVAEAADVSIVMAYRNTGTGNDSQASLFGRWMSRGLPVICASETNPVSAGVPPKTTYTGKTLAQMEAQHAELSAQFQSSFPVFLGQAIHHYHTYKEMV